MGDAESDIVARSRAAIDAALAEAAAAGVPVGEIESPAGTLGDALARHAWLMPRLVRVAAGAPDSAASSQQSHSGIPAFLTPSVNWSEPALRF